MKWRLIRDGSQKAPMNMGVDEAILDAVAGKSSRPTLRLYGWRPAAVSIGMFQSLSDAVDMAACQREGVDVVRRISGGGSVFHGEGGEVTYSVTLRNESLPARDFISSFEYVLGGVADALRSFGLDAEFAPINDVVVNGRKISGSAQARRNGAVLQHGTVLLNMDKELAFRLLKVPDLKVREKALGTPSQRVTSLSAEGVKTNQIGVRSALEKGFAKALQAEFTPGKLSGDEAKASTMYSEQRYSQDAWTRSR